MQPFKYISQDALQRHAKHLGISEAPKDYIGASFESVKRRRHLKGRFGAQAFAQCYDLCCFQRQTWTAANPKLRQSQLDTDENRWAARKQKHKKRKSSTENTRPQQDQNIGIEQDIQQQIRTQTVAPDEVDHPTRFKMYKPEKMLLELKQAQRQEGLLQRGSKKKAHWRKETVGP